MTDEGAAVSLNYSCQSSSIEVAASHPAGQLVVPNAIVAYGWISVIVKEREKCQTS